MDFKTIVLIVVILVIAFVLVRKFLQGVQEAEDEIDNQPPRYKL